MNDDPQVPSGLFEQHVAQQDILTRVIWAPWPKDPKFELAEIALLRIARKKSTGSQYLRELDEDGEFVGERLWLAKS